MALIVYNSLVRKLEPFQPITEGRVHIYVCGPTVYASTHIGHAKTYVSFDVIVRYLRYSGYRVRYVQNITDVGHLLDSGEDRILKGSARESMEPMELVERYTREYFEGMDALGVVRPDISPRASAHIPEQIEWVKRLLENGHAYEQDGSVYFDVRSFPEYGKLSGRRVEEQEEGARVEVREEKRHPADFALWKKAEPEHILRWPSPWGWGFPGWHIECSAMSTKYLGETFDIHGGGVDNIFPHNECEIAQAEAATGKPFARYWLLTGSLTVGGVKMSKSLNNFVSLQDALARFRPEAIRFFILSGNYRSPLDYSEEAMRGAVRGWERLVGPYAALVQRLAAPEAGDPTQSSAASALAEDVRRRFREAMDEDFNAPAAIAALFEFTREVNTGLGTDKGFRRKDQELFAALYRELAGDVLGLLPRGDGGSSPDREASLIRLLVGLRDEARARKDWTLSDSIRKRLEDIGVMLEDGKEGTTWKIQ
ncbi:MAG: cysteine--tRNA ligase [Anaerolineales bacterium]|nr:cysteine--tRNA ligase [Anaerolineales bacterium]